MTYEEELQENMYILLKKTIEDEKKDLSYSINYQYKLHTITDIQYNDLTNLCLKYKKEV